MFAILPNSFKFPFFSFAERFPFLNLLQAGLLKKSESESERLASELFDSE